MAGTSFAKTTSGSDNGGNGNGHLFISTVGTNPVLTNALTIGKTYDFVLANPGGKTKEKNLKHVPTTLTFNFYPSTVKLHGNPKDLSKLGTPVFTVMGTEIGTRSPYTYKVPLTSPSVTSGNYNIITGYATSNGKHSEDTFYFSTDPSLTNPTVVTNPPAGELPEIPYTGIFAFVILATGATYLILNRKARVS